MEWDDYDSEDDAESLALAVQVAVLAIIVRRLGHMPEGVSWRWLERAIATDTGRIDRALEKGANECRALIRRMYADGADAVDGWASTYRDARGLPEASWREDGRMQGLVKASGQRAYDSVADLLRTRVVAIQGPNGIYVPVREAYRTIGGLAVQGMAGGSMDYMDAVRDAVNAVARGGLRVQYRSGATRELFAALRTNIVDGYRAHMDMLRDEAGKAFGADGVEVSAHPLCAEDHGPFQGRQYTKAEFAKVNGNLARPIGEGMNCRHIVTPIIMGVSAPAYTEGQLRGYEDDSHRRVSWTGMDGKERTATAYEATQHQRRVESSYRRASAARYLSAQAGLADAERASAKRMERIAEYYDRMCRQMGIDGRPERLHIFTL